MNRNVYDNDVATWSPKGKLWQVQYAEKAVTIGNAGVGIKSRDYTVIAAFKRPQAVLAESVQKIFKIDDHVGMFYAGLTVDGNSTATYLRTEALHHKLFNQTPVVTGRLVSDLGDKFHARTQVSWGRPYGIGVLLIGHDADGPHLYQAGPAGDVQEVQATAIGGRAQSAVSYLRGKMKEDNKVFETATKDELIFHAIKALKNAYEEHQEIEAGNTAIAFLGKDAKYTVLEGKELEAYLDKA